MTAHGGRGDEQQDQIDGTYVTSSLDFSTRFYRRLRPLAMSSFPFPSTGDNPFAFYRSVLRAHSIHLPDDPAGFRARLIVLFIVVACLFLTSLLNFALHILSYRIKGRSIWLFRLVERDGSK